jgi:pyruvate formate-lyase/glycerol dehydratase family glycyl radical enzyme
MSDSVWANTPVETRGQKLWRVLRARRDTEPVSLERARLLTSSFKETEGLPLPLRRAWAFEKIVTEIPIYIDDDQLLVGDYGSTPMAPEFFPEFTVEWVSDAIEQGIQPTRAPIKDMGLLKEICDYWKKNSSREGFLRWLSEEEKQKYYEAGDPGSWLYGTFLYPASSKGWNVPNYAKAINLGFSGILAEIENELQTMKMSDEESWDKKIFLQALAIEVKAAIKYGKRYEKLAKVMAKNASGKRKQELLSIAENCSIVPEQPARTFWQAIQTLHFSHLMIYWDARTFGVSPGRVDQYLYPFYKKDIDTGKIDNEEAVEILECLRVKVNSERQLYPAFVSESSSGETQFYNCTLGGQTPDGNDATNELSYLWLEAACRVKNPHPTLSIRVHEKLSPEFALKGAELCRMGMGYPAWFGDNSTIPFMLEHGVTLTEARNYALAGCVLSVVPGKTPAAVPMVINLPKVLEISLYNGLDPGSNKQVGLAAGHFEDFKTYEEFYQAFREQARFIVSEAAQFLHKFKLWRQMILPQMFSSCLFDDCIKRGKNVVGGGAVYHQLGGSYALLVGAIDVADSLAAIKKCVFEDHSVNQKQLVGALKNNFQSSVEVRKILLAAPKYGNDDDYADKIAADVYTWLCDIIEGTEGLFGTHYLASPHNMSFHGACGKKVGALPSGRLSGLALSDGAVSPCQGADKNGPTAVINSAGKIDTLRLYGAVFNMKFSPDALKTREDLGKFLSLIKTYLIDYGGKHIQFNIVSRKTLLDAQAHPEQYRNLVVRVAGYSALWSELERTIQDEIIARTEQTL